MKRGPGPRRDPAKVRAWQEKHRGSLKPPEKPLARSSLKPGRPGGRTPRAASTPADGVLTPLEWRRAVWEADEGRCVNCGGEVPRDADLWTWSPHHPLPKQRLKREGLRRLVHDVRFGVVLCKRCHERHETATYRVPGARLPARVHAGLHDVGVWAVDVVDRLHP